MTKLAVMQPYLFPYIGYFQLIGAVDKFVVYDDVNFIKKGWINRNNILINNQANLFSIPLKEASQNKLINEIYISEDEKWRSTFLKTIAQAYKKAPYFEPVYALIEEIITAEVSKISDLIVASLSRLNTYMGITTILVESAVIYEAAHLKGQERILEICKKEKAAQYINPIGGQELYSKDLFKENGIALNFIKTQPIQYAQFGKEFIPWLSIIDVLMFNNKEQIKVMLNQYELI
ncbi:MAG: WbqC family protein [Bacteroidetes bacterium]|nr:WbqC family protein [Bacteroidota bacterium]